MTGLPQDIPLWTIILPFLALVAVSAIHRLVRQELITPQIEFSFPHTVDLSGWQIEVPENLEFATITVRNNPKNRVKALAAVGAYVAVEFFDLKTEESVLKFYYPHWENNPITNRAHFPTGTSPVWKDEWNYRTLHPNNEPHRINFAMKYKDKDVVCGFRGECRYLPLGTWMHERFKAKGSKWKVRLTVDATNMKEAAKYDIYMENPGAGKSLITIPFREYTKQRKKFKWPVVNISALKRLVRLGR